MTSLHGSSDFDRSVFINCPFDADYRPLLQALLFLLLECGLRPRIASETSDSGEVRIDKIRRMIRESRYSIHDICRIETTESLPRFNMPFELGMDVGSREYGDGRLQTKRSLILDKEPYRYQKFLSDIAGQDIKSHKGQPEELIRQVRNWIVSTIPGSEAPRASRVWQRYLDFRLILDVELPKDGYTAEDISGMPFREYIDTVRRWQTEVADRQ